MLGWFKVCLGMLVVTASNELLGILADLYTRTPLIDRRAATIVLGFVLVSWWVYSEESPATLAERRRRGFQNARRTIDLLFNTFDSPWLGDIEERYRDVDIQAKGARAAQLWALREIVRALPLASVSFVHTLVSRRLGQSQ